MPRFAVPENTKAHLCGFPRSYAQLAAEPVPENTKEAPSATESCRPCISHWDSEDLIIPLVSLWFHRIRLDSGFVFSGTPQEPSRTALLRVASEAPFSGRAFKATGPLGSSKSFSSDQWLTAPSSLERESDLSRHRLRKILSAAVQRVIEDGTGSCYQVRSASRFRRRSLHGPIGLKLSTTPC